MSYLGRGSDGVESHRVYVHRAGDSGPGTLHVALLPPCDAPLTDGDIESDARAIVRFFQDHLPVMTYRRLIDLLEP